MSKLSFNIHRKVLVVGDIHEGSIFGLCPRKFRTGIGGNKRRYIPTVDQYKLIKIWENMAKRVGPVHAVFLLGDLVDGGNKRQKGLDIWTSSMKEQVEAAAQTLEMIEMEPGYEKEFYFCGGSDYHVGGNPNYDFEVADEMGVGKAHYSDEMYVKIPDTDIIAHLAHRVGVSQSVYKTTALERERTMAGLVADYTDINANLIIRGHAHYSRLIEGDDRLAFINPCFQFRTRFMTKIGIGCQPQIGYTVLYITDEGDIIPKITRIPISQKYKVVTMK